MTTNQLNNRIAPVLIGAMIALAANQQFHIAGIALTALILLAVFAGVCEAYNKTKRKPSLMDGAPKVIHLYLAAEDHARIKQGAADSKLTLAQFAGGSLQLGILFSQTLRNKGQFVVHTPNQQPTTLDAF